MSKQILFRSHGIGALSVDGRGSVITDLQLEKLKDFEGRLRMGGKLTDNQKAEMFRLREKRDAPFELSDTAKQYVDDTWLEREKGFVKRIKSPYLEKGIFGEEIGLNLLSELDGRFYEKNTERVSKGNITGECDNKFTFNGKKIVQDVKCCWDAKTFKNSELNFLYEFQGRSYLDLYEADEFWLRYCLVDCPPHLVNREKEIEWRKFYDNSMSDVEAQQLEEMMQPIYDQIDRNLIYTNNPAYKLEERVKTIVITRDDVIFEERILSRIPYALDYYKTIRLNAI